MNRIIIISDDKCKKCEALKATIRQLLDIKGIKAEVRVIKNETDEAVDLAIDHDLSNIPCMVVNGVGINEYEEALFLKNLKRGG